MRPRTLSVPRHGNVRVDRCASRWKHAAACHQGSTIAGEGDAFVEDKVYAAVCAIGAAGGATPEV